MVSQMLQNSTTYYFNKNIYSTSTKIISFNKNIYSTSTNKNSIQQQYLFSELQPKLFSFNKNIYSTSTKNNFIQQQSSRTLKISSFNKIPHPSLVKYKTALSHASNISKTLSNTQLRDEQIILLSRGLKFIPAPEIHSCSGASYSMTSVNLPEECTLNTYFTGTVKNLIRPLIRSREICI